MKFFTENWKEISVFLEKYGETAVKIVSPCSPVSYTISQVKGDVKKGSAMEARESVVAQLIIAGLTDASARGLANANIPDGCEEFNFGKSNDCITYNFSGRFVGGSFHINYTIITLTSEWEKTKMCVWGVLASAAFATTNPVVAAAVGVVAVGSWVSERHSKKKDYDKLCAKLQAAVALAAQDPAAQIAPAAN